MPEYVYALHDFLPEHEDEVSFHAGERIEVVERDDLYGDGWWQGKNLAGKQGLFPQSYTAPAPPPESIPTPASPAPIPAAGQSPLQSLQEEPEPLPPAVDNGEVMKATMTDVQKAIEQLGRNQDGARSFSFASSRDGDTTETDMDTDDGGDEVDDDWHKGRQDARKKLADASRRAVEEMEAAEKAPVRSLAPPIDLDVSDESEGEDEEDDHHWLRDHPRINEEDEDDFNNGRTNTTVSRTETPDVMNVPPKDDTQLPTATASQTSFPAAISPSQTPEIANDHSSSPEPTGQQQTSPPVTPPSLTIPTSPMADAPRSPLSYAASVPSSLRETSLPPAPSSFIPNHTKQNSVGSAAGVTVGFPQQSSKHSSLASSAKASGSGSGQPETPATSASQHPGENSLKPVVHPSEWSVEEVIDWLKSKGFDQDVCGKFIEQEITGDVLLELDANLLKTEIGIVAFGKRVRIANAIADLRRPPSVNYSDHPEHPMSIRASPSQMHMHNTPSPHNNGSPQFMHGHSHSIQSSAPSALNGFNGVNGLGIGMGPGSPGGFSTGGFSQGGGYASASPRIHQNGGLMSPESPHGGDLAGNSMARDPRRYTVSDGGSWNPASPTMDEFGRTGEGNGEETRHAGRGMEKAAAVLGLDLEMRMSSETSHSRSQKGRPSQLMLSPSDGALKGKAGNNGVQSRVDDSEDRGALSEGETQSKRRRLFGRSADSSVKDKDSIKEKDESIKAAESSPMKEFNGSVTSRHRAKKNSIDGGRPADRPSSIFGAAFGGGANKARKPAPRYSSVESSDGEKAHGLARLYGSTGGRKSSGRPSTAEGTTTPASPSPKEKQREKQIPPPLKPSPLLRSTAPDKASKDKDPQVLRKRNSVASPSTPDPPQRAAAGALKAGVSVLEQIGTPDHNGWMRKKGDKFNTYKMRYFVLKGDYLYFLKSNSKAETKIKGVINIVGYRVIADEDANPGRYGFRITHEADKTHWFSSDEQLVIRDWMKAFKKATIGRDYSKPVISSCNIPTIPLTVAQAMNPAPRPPSPTARDATQKAMRRGDTTQLSTRDARVLMGIPSETAKEDYTRADAVFQDQGQDADARYMGDSSSMMTPQIPKTPIPPRPSREGRRSSVATVALDSTSPAEDNLIAWANGHLSHDLRIEAGTLCGGLELLRLAEDIKGRPCVPPVLDSEFPTTAGDDKLDGLFKLFDFLLDNEVKMGNVSINDIKSKKRDKILQLLKALKAWEEKRSSIANSVMAGTMSAGGFVTTSQVPWTIY